MDFFKSFHFGMTAKFMSVLGLVFILMMMGVPSKAGDQDGVTGYRFKVYDADGDGIDGNEVGSIYGDGSGLSSNVPQTTISEPTIDLEIVVKHVRWLLLLRWLR